jgi:hypothetical protein
VVTDQTAQPLQQVLVAVAEVVAAHTTLRIQLVVPVVRVLLLFVTLYYLIILIQEE